MGRFRVDDPEIDVEVLEAQVEARIAEKTGSRYTEGDLEVLRRAALQPRLERHHLSYGVLEEMPRVRGKLSAPGPPPPPLSARAPEGEPVDGEVGASEELAPADINPPRDLYTSASTGLKGRLIGLLRRCLRPVLRTSSNLEHMLVELLAEMRRQDRWLGDVAATQALRIDRSFDALKSNLDQRIDGTADWAGEQLSGLTGQLEGRHETQLHLLHNLVYELSCARVDMDSIQDQINELQRQFETLSTRERTLERLYMGGGDDD